MTSNWIEDTEIVDYTNFLKRIPELMPLQEHPECYERLAEILERKFLRKGVDSDCLTGGWMIIESGLIGRERSIDFSNVEIDSRRLLIGNVEIGLPNGSIKVRTDTFGPHHLVVDPSFSKILKKPYNLSVLEDSVVLVIPCDELLNLLPLDIKREVEKIVLNDPTDKELANYWLERERERQWIMFKHRCTKEARAYVGMVTRQDLGLVLVRKPKPPRAAHGSDPYRQRFRPISTSLFSERQKV
jgi:hypothetical protein